jgi:hypothetical protein
MTHRSSVSESSKASLNYCRACNTDFAALEAFDLHRVGTHAYTFGEGIRQTHPPRTAAAASPPTR